jgi:choline dehydrogenase-like flavoprotein
MPEFPTQAQVVIIGGGVGGVSIAYHLAKMGWRDVVVLERHELTAGSTWHSAGLVGQMRSDANLTRMMHYSTDLYRRLKDETGHDPAWREVGGLRLASSPERMEDPQAPGRVSPLVWRADGAALPQRGLGEVPAHVPRRRAGSSIHPQRRHYRPNRPDQRPGNRRQAVRGANLDRDQRRSHQLEERARGRSSHQPGDDQDRGCGQCSRPVGRFCRKKWSA